MLSSHELKDASEFAGILSEPLRVDIAKLQFAGSLLLLCQLQVLPAHGILLTSNTTIADSITGAVQLRGSHTPENDMCVVLRIRCETTRCKRRLS